MASPRRQQLIRLSGAGWARMLDAPWDAVQRNCLSLWAARELPLVVTRQALVDGDRIAAGLPAPARFGRRRIALAVEARDVMFFDEFPPADAIARLLPRGLAAAWRALHTALAAADCTPRVYGGYGWQSITGLAYIHARSDLDLLLPVNSTAHADAVARLLASTEGVRSCRLPLADLAERPSLSEDGQKAGPDTAADTAVRAPTAWAGPRLDGELLFPDGGAVAWREWHAHRQGQATRVLVKRLHGVALEVPA